MNPIQLLYANNVITRKNKGVRQLLTFVILLENFDSNKQVDIVWCGENGEWQTSVGDAGQYPGKLDHLRNIRLHPKDAPIGIEAQCHEIGRCFDRSFGKLGALCNACQGMEVDNEHEKLRSVHIRDHGLHHPEIVAQVQRSGGLYS